MVLPRPARYVGDGVSFWTPDAKEDAFVASLKEAELCKRIERIASAFHKTLGCPVCETAEPCGGREKLVSMLRREMEIT